MLFCFENAEIEMQIGVLVYFVCYNLLILSVAIRAFVRNLHHLDDRYTDDAVMRRLGLRVAQGLPLRGSCRCMHKGHPPRSGPPGILTNDTGE